MNIYHTNYVDLRESLDLVDQWVLQLNDIFPEFAEKLRDLPIAQRVPYLREPAAREQVPRAEVAGAWFHLYNRICYIQETLELAKGNRLLLLTVPGGAKYDDLNGIVYDADLSEGLVTGDA